MEFNQTVCHEERDVEWPVQNSFLQNFQGCAVERQSSASQNVQYDSQALYYNKITITGLSTGFDKLILFKLNIVLRKKVFVKAYCESKLLDKLHLNKTTKTNL